MPGFSCFFLLTHSILVLMVGKGKSSKKAKAAEPSGDEMHAVVVDILKEVDFNTVSNTFPWAVASCVLS